MSLETASFIHQLNPSNPSGADRLKEGDDHIRLIKAALKATFPGITGPLDASITQDFLKGLAGQLVPRGVITLFAGEVAPAGWAFCNGAEVNLSDGTGKITTPDLRGRVPVGANADHKLGALFGATSTAYTTEVAGAHSHEATAANAGAHTHDLSGTAAKAATGETLDGTLSRGSKDHDSSGSYYESLVLKDPGHTHTLSGTATSAGEHSHTITVKQADGHAHKVTVDATQPSIAVNFIIKV